MTKHSASITIIIKYRRYPIDKERHTLMGFFAIRFLSGGGINQSAKNLQARSFADRWSSGEGFAKDANTLGAG